MASEVDPLSRALSHRFRQRPALGPGGAVAAEDPGISATSTSGTSGIPASSRRGSRSRYSASPRAAGQTPRPIAIAGGDLRQAGGHHQGGAGGRPRHARRRREGHRRPVRRADHSVTNGGPGHEVALRVLGMETHGQPGLERCLVGRLSGGRLRPRRGAAAKDWRALPAQGLGERGTRMVSWKGPPRGGPRRAGSCQAGRANSAGGPGGCVPPGRAGVRLSAGNRERHVSADRRLRADRRLPFSGAHLEGRLGRLVLLPPF